jgi:hypothetical protein
MNRPFITAALVSLLLLAALVAALYFPADRSGSSEDQPLMLYCAAGHRWPRTRRSSTAKFK